MNAKVKAKKFQTISKHSLNTAMVTGAKKSVTVISHNRRSADVDDVERKNGRNASMIDTKLLQPKSGENKYSKPELNSALLVAKRLDALKNPSDDKLTDFNQMTPRTKTIATEKALRMLNVHPEKTVYKHLVPVNVNDSVLDVKPSPVRRQAKSKTYVQMSKDPEPILNRYLQPTPRLVHHLTLDDVDDDDDIGSNNRASINKRADNQFKRMHEFYAQYLSPTSAKMYSDSR